MLSFCIKLMNHIQFKMTKAFLPKNPGSFNPFCLRRCIEHMSVAKEFLDHQSLGSGEPYVFYSSSFLKTLQSLSQCWIFSQNLKIAHYQTQQWKSLNTLIKHILRHYIFSSRCMSTEICLAQILMIRFLIFYNRSRRQRIKWQI